MPFRLIVEKKFLGYAEFRVCWDVVVPPMPAEEAIRLIRAHIHRDIALYKKEALFNLVAGKPIYLGRKWSLGFRKTPDKYRTHLDFVIGYSERAWGVLYKLFVIPSIQKEQSEGFAQVIRAWLAHAEPVKGNSF